ncbi:concanavalin A-like lectin/glucanase domain-containing protein [Cyathus striatus]|nr:concanavalin A-like lectin/glucanase domain-containing protein [Cyathus striatus]
MMKKDLWPLGAVLLLQLCFVWAVHVPLREHIGPTFFDDWDFYGLYDNTTWGNVTYQDRANATSQHLAYINEAGNAIVRVDNTTNIADAPLIHRDSVRITSRDAYGVGTVLIIDALHIPYGCSVWPSFWTFGTGKEWPDSGEIDIIEAINLMTHNQIALHTIPGCMLTAPPDQYTGTMLNDDCSQDRGCIVAENKPNSYGEGFNQAGGGVFATQIDETGVFVWFWSRPDIPDDIKNAYSNSTIDVTTWGRPTAAYPTNGCNINEFFTPQKMVLLITLCGVWAGAGDNYSNTCQTPTNSCVRDNIIGPGSPKFDQAYWEVRYIRTYILEGLTPPPSAGPDPLLPRTSTSSEVATATSASASSSESSSTSQPSSSDAHAVSGVRAWVSNVFLLFVITASAYVLL